MTPRKPLPLVLTVSHETVTEAVVAFLRQRHPAFFALVADLEVHPVYDENESFGGVTVHITLEAEGG